MKQKTGNEIQINEEIIYFGYSLKKPNIAINFLILLAKRYIYKCKLNKTKPIFSIYKLSVQDAMEIDYQIASRRNKLATHFSKWDGFFS